MKIFTIAGWSNSGKTTLIIKLIKELKKKKLKVLALKNAKEKYYLEPEGKDSISFLKAGADCVYLTAKKEIMKMELISDNNRIFEMLESEYSKYEIILLEGLVGEKIPIIEVYNSKNNNELKFPLKNISLIVSDKKVSDSVPYCNRDDIAAILDFLLS